MDASAGTTEAFPAFLTERDIAALLFVAEMYAVQLDQLATVLGVTEARARAITLGWRRGRYAESARIGPGRTWVWLTRSGLA
ncbi:MAG: hypothetical protein J2P30_20150, partial [Actinobacteria bacterium]|nr:hypothetical protein [Actinomycetota bacterium]